MHHSNTHGNYHPHGVERVSQGRSTHGHPREVVYEHQPHHAHNSHGYPREVVYEHQPHHAHVVEPRKSYRKSERVVRGEGRLVGEGRVTHHGEEQVVTEQKLAHRELGTTTMDDHATVTYHDLERRVIGHEHGSTHIVNEYMNPMEQVVTRQAHQTRQVDRHVDALHENCEVNEIIVEVEVEVIKERPVAVQVYKDVYYDVEVTKPIEKVIEKEVVRHIIIEKPVQKIIEIPVERIVEVPIERIIEKPIYIEDIVEVPIERIEEVYIESTEYVEIPHYSTVEIDARDIGHYKNQQYSEMLPTRVIEHKQDVFREVDVCVGHNIITERKEIPVEHKVHEHYDVVNTVYVDNIIEVPKPVERIQRVRVEQPFEHIVYQDDVRQVHVPIYVERISEKRVEYEVIKEIIVEEEEVHTVVKPIYIDQVTVHEIEHIMEVPVANHRHFDRVTEVFVEVPVYIEVITERPYEVVEERQVPYEVVRQEVVERVVEDYIDRPVENVVHREIPQDVYVEVEHVVRKPVYVENVVEREYIVEQVVEHAVENVVERPVQREVIIEKEIIMERIVHHHVDVIVEVERPVEVINYVEVEVPVDVERIVRVPRTFEKEVVYEKEVFKPMHVETIIEQEIDWELRHRLDDHESRIRELKIKKKKLKYEVEDLTKRLSGRSMGGNRHEEIAALRRKIYELEELLRQYSLTVLKPKTKVTTVYHKQDAEGNNLNSKLLGLRDEQETLRSRLSFHGNRVVHSHSNYEHDIVEGGHRVLRGSHRGHGAKVTVKK